MQPQKKLEPEYSLGHSEKERQRLRRQAEWFEPYTLRLLQNAGIHEGMRVLDLGCGVGDVAFAARKLVGDSGEILGIDRSEVAVTEARQRAQAAGFRNVNFQTTELGDFRADKKFNAVVGRLVLMYQPDPAATLKSLLPFLGRQSIFAFQEADYRGASFSYPEDTLYSRTFKMITETMATTSDVRMGAKLYRTFIAAGLPAPKLHIEVLTGGADDFPGFEIAAEIARSILPTMEREGYATAAELKVDTLAERMRKDARDKNATCSLIAFVSAWTRIK